jgi:hypothetical protein
VNQALGVVINGSIIRELQFIPQHSNVHIQMVVNPKRRLQHQEQKEGERNKPTDQPLLTIPVNIS